SGTDPSYASALTIGLLEHLHGKGARVVATTHLDQVKAWALDQRWVTNASVRFDVDEMRPTYELMLGVPGGSSALSIARRLGFEESIIARAEQLRAGDPTGDLETTIRKLEAQRDALAAQVEATAQAEADARLREHNFEQQLERLRRGELET